MKRWSILRLRQNTEGTTLVEAVCGILILTTIVVAMYAGFVVAQKTFVQGDAREAKGQAAFAALELGEGIEGAEQTFVFPLGDLKVNFSGKYSSAGGEDGGVTLYSFETGALNFADGVRNMYIYWETRLKSMTPAERKAIGFTSNTVNNSPIRNFVREKEYGGNWPVLSRDFLERYLSDADKAAETRRGGGSLLVNDIYIQSYHTPTPDGNDVSVNTFVFAAAHQGDNWNVRLIYDHEEKAWYYRQKGDTTAIVNKEWAMVKEMIHGPEWRKLV